MVALSRPGIAPPHIRRATTLDNPWLVELGTRAFADLGDYRDVLPAWLAQPNVATWIDDPSPRRGFAMVAFYRDELTGEQIADLLAITVDPVWRRHGLGQALLQHTIGVARAAAKQARLAELRLCVADDNARAQQLYLRAGFQPVGVDVGRYAAGQRAVRMVYPLR